MKMKVKIVAIGKDDAKHYRWKDFINKTGEFVPNRVYKGGFRSGTFYPDEPEYLDEMHYFLRVKIHKI